MAKLRTESQLGPMMTLYLGHMHGPVPGPMQPAESIEATGYITAVERDSRTITMSRSRRPGQ